MIYKHFVFFTNPPKHCFKFDLLQHRSYEKGGRCLFQPGSEVVYKLITMISKVGGGHGFGGRGS
jgi:hypothetical protein